MLKLQVEIFNQSRAGEWTSSLEKITIVQVLYFDYLSPKFGLAGLRGSKYIFKPGAAWRRAGCLKLIRKFFLTNKLSSTHWRHFWENSSGGLTGNIFSLPAGKIVITWKHVSLVHIYIYLPTRRTAEKGRTYYLQWLSNYFSTHDLIPTRHLRATWDRVWRESIEFN